MLLLKRALAVSLLSMVASCATLYPGQRGAGVVVDAETSLPFADVVVAAAWVVSGPEGTREEANRFLYMTDTVTDGHGRFTFSISADKVRALNHAAVLRDTPGVAAWRLYLLKPGYHYMIIAQSGPRPSHGFKGFDLNRLTDPTWWDGQVFHLRRLVGRPTEFLDAIDLRMLPLHECRWAEIPHMAAAYVRALEISNDSLAHKRSQELLHESCPNALYPLIDCLR